MSAATVARLERDIAALRARLVPPPIVPSALEAFRLAVGEPDAWQVGVLVSDAPNVLMLAARQTGKTGVAAVLAAQHAAAVPGSLTLVLSPSLRQSAELYRRVREVLLALGDAAPPAVDASAVRVELANGSRVISLPGGRDDTIRGYPSVSLLIFDEGARVGDRIYAAMRPALAVSGGRTVALSTPFGRRGWFHREWAEGGDDWFRAVATAYDCPRIPRAWVDAERARVGDWWWRQEFLVEFLEAEDQLFADADIDAALDPGLAPLFAQEAA